MKININGLLKILLLIISIKSYSQCAFPVGATQTGSTQTFCVNTPSQSQNVTNVKGNNFVLINIVQGFTYSFSVGDAFTPDSENLNIFDAFNVNIGFASGAVGASISNWVAPFSGQIKLTLSYGACNATSPTGKTITLSLISVGNTFDNQNTFGTDTWIGHAYNWTGVAPPGGASPATLATTLPFNSANYVGYYTVPTESFAEGFGGNYNCFSLLSDGLVRTTINTETFAVRYKMKSTRPAGCYIATFRGDDGIRLYVDNQLVFNRWIEQAPTNYFNVFIYLDGDADLIYDFYENGGQNEAQFSLAPFDSATNSISLIGSKPMVIQGRSVPFDVNDVVPIGVQIPIDGTYTIAIATVDGLFAQSVQMIYLEDKFTNTTCNISQNTYIFESKSGIFNNRFLLKFIDSTLDNTKFNINNILIYVDSNKIYIKSGTELILSYEIYDILGRVLISNENVLSNQVIHDLKSANQNLFIKVKLLNNQIISKRIYK